MINIAGLEAIKYQSNPKLGDELTALFEKFRNYIKTTDANEKMQDKVGTGYARKQFYLKEFGKQISPKFINIVNDNTNLTVKHVQTCPPGTMWGFYAVLYEFSDKQEPFLFDKIISGDLPPTTQQKDSLLTNIKNLHEALDLKTSKLDLSKMDKKMKLDVTIYFDLGAAFFIQEYIDRDPLTSQELAAIMLHEIGHIVTLFEYAANFVYTNNLLKEQHDAMMKHSNSKDTLTVLKELLSVAEKYNDNPKDIKTIDKTKKVLNNFSNVIDKLEKVGQRSSLTMVRKITNCIFRILNLIALPIYELMMVPLISMTKFESNRDLYKTLDENKGKGSEYAVTRKNLYKVENLADEYVVRQGYGMYISSGLNKIAEYDITLERNSAVPTVAVILFPSLILSFILMAAVEKIFHNKYRSTNTYADSIRRSEQILNNTIEVLKDRDIEPSVRDRLLTHVKSIEKSILAEKKRIKQSKLKKAFDVVSDIVSSKALYSLLMGGNFIADMEKQLDALEDMSNNKLYAKYHEFRQLAKKVK